MNLAFLVILGFATLLAVLALATRVSDAVIGRRHPPVGSFAEVGGTSMHYVHLKPGHDTALPPVVFLHGATGNLKDQLVPLRPLLEGRAELLFLDRPGHGWSDRGPPSNAGLDGQSDTIAALMAHLGIERAILVGHSFGGAIAATFALRHPDRTAGLVFLAAASHPWPGGTTSWEYDLANMPVLGFVLSETLVWLAGILRIRAAARCVFAPNRMPDDYLQKASIPLILRPKVFRANAEDVDKLYDNLEAVSPRYHEIVAPTVVVSGNRDTIVYEEVHSLGLVRDIPDAELVWVDNLGHKPDWIAADLAAAAVEKVAGLPVDLAAAAAAVEARIAGDAFGPSDRFTEPQLTDPLPDRRPAST